MYYTNTDNKSDNDDDAMIMTTMTTMTMTMMTMTKTTMTMTTMTKTMMMKAWYALGRGRPDCEEGEGTLSSAITLAIAVTLYCPALHEGEGGLEMPW